MAKKYRESADFRHVFWLTVIYILAHWMILISTGRWWDDWVYADHNAEYVMEAFKQSSLPLAGVVNIIIWYIPYKLFVFVMFYAGGILLYRILQQIDFFSDDAVFWISALFLIIPINDARILYICFNYSLGLFCYLLSFFLITKWLRQSGKRRYFMRAFSLLILLLAFNAESIMLMVVLMLLYMYYEDLKTDWNWREVRVNIRKLFYSVLHYMDFLLLPIANYILTKIFFPAYGVYGGHSYIPWDSLADRVKNSPQYTWQTFKLIFSNWKDIVMDKPGQIVLFGTLMMCMIIYYVSKSRGIPYFYEKSTLETDILYLLLGVLVFYLGIFPYIVKRGDSINVIYCAGRDALLLGIGTAMIIYYSLHLFVRGELRRTVMVLLIVSGIIYFNNVYLVWEKSNYQQLQIRDEMAVNQEIRDNNNFLVIYSGAVICSNHAQTNGNSWIATGEQTRHYVCGTRDLERLIEMRGDELYLNAYAMKDFDYTDKTIDGVIYVNYDHNFSGKGRGAILMQKWNEFFNKDRFNQWIRELKEIDYYAITPEQSDAIIEAYQNDELTDENLIDYVLQTGW